MNAFPPRTSLALWLGILGAVLVVVAGPPPLAIYIPWIYIYAVLVAALVLGWPLLDAALAWLARREPETEDTRYDR
jgi:hypothetical protein